MPLLNFQKRFAPLVANGSKSQTIRAKRKDCKNPRPGQTLYCYSGLRTRNCVKLGEFICKSVEEIAITEEGIIFYQGRYPSTEESHQMAMNDGFRSFDSWYELRCFFKDNHGLPFFGLLIKW